MFCQEFRIDIPNYVEQEPRAVKPLSLRNLSTTIEREVVLEKAR